MSILMSATLPLSPQKVVTLSPHLVKGLQANGIPTAVEYRYCNCRKTVAGLKGYENAESGSWPGPSPGWGSLAPATIYDRWERDWTLYKDRSDAWSSVLTNIDPPSTGSNAYNAGYGGSMSLSGAGDCPVVSGYPNLIEWTPDVPWPNTTEFIWHITYLSPPGPPSLANSGWWDFYGEDPPSNIGIGIGIENFPPTGVTATSKTFHVDVYGVYNDPSTDLWAEASEDLTMTLSNLQDCAGKFGAALTAFMGQSFGTNWSVDSQFDMTFNDWFEFSGRDGSNAWALTPSNYDGATIVSALYTSEITAYTSSALGSGWDVSVSSWAGSGGGGAILMRRCQVRLTLTKPVLCSLAKFQGYNSSPVSGQWIQRVTKVRDVVLFPDSTGHAVYEVPFTDDAPFPLIDIHDVPVIQDFYILIVPTLTNPNYGDKYQP